MFFKKVYFSKLKTNAIIPTKTKENAGYDFYACFDEDFIEINQNQTTLIPTGIAWASSPKYYLQIEERSSTGVKGIKKNAGVIDSGYRGEIKIAIYNSTPKKLFISNLDESDLLKKYKDIDFSNSIIYPTKKAIAQGIIHKLPNLKTKEIPYEKLLKIKSERKLGGFGSSKK